MRTSSNSFATSSALAEICALLSAVRHTTKCGVEQIGGVDLNGDNLRISVAYLRISDHCRLTVRVRIRVWVRVRVRIKVRVRVMVRFRVADCCIQTAGEIDKMRINHVLKTDQWRCAPQIRPARHFVVFRSVLDAKDEQERASG